MATKKKDEKNQPAETLGEMLRTFGNTVSELLNDPKVKATAKEFAASVVDAAAKMTESKIKTEEARSKFRNVGKAAQTLGNSLDEHFKSAGV